MDDINDTLDESKKVIEQGNNDLSVNVNACTLGMRNIIYAIERSENWNRSFCVFLPDVYIQVLSETLSVTK